MKRLVFIVDDSPSCAETLEIALETVQGVEVRVVKSGEAAIIALREASTVAREVAAVVTDLHMPQADGFDLIRRLRAETGSRLPVIMISGDSDPRIPGRALAEGADAFFAKPYSPGEVRRKLEQLL